ncbi:MAG: hypothetical protein KAX19_05675, partial [Candidatus Brocadiae bacterium]|nr:hypothetical protein [Candidatus Brocadiia bacterium]
MTIAVCLCARALVTGAVLEDAGACTLGVADGQATRDGRPLMWRVCNSKGEGRQQLVYSDGSP